MKNICNRIFVTGDTHGGLDINKLNKQNFAVQEQLTKDDYLLDWYESKSYTTIFIDGNHENHKLLNSFPVESWHGGLVHRIRPSIIHLMRG